MAIHTLLGLCYNEGCGDFHKGLAHLEKALESASDPSSKAALARTLASGYFQRSREAQEAGQPQDAEDVRHAAGHLFRALEADTRCLTPDQALWLGNYYLRTTGYPTALQEPIEQEMRIAAARARAAYEVALSIEGISPCLMLARENIRREKELYKIAWLSRLLGEEQTALNLLQHLSQQFENHPEYPWRMQGEVWLLTAQLLERLEQPQCALQLYAQIRERALTLSPIIVNQANLKWALLAYESLPAGQRRLDDPQVQAIICTLKDLQIHKVLAQEPIHLKAALELVELRTQLTAAPERVKRRLFLMQRVLEDFNHCDDLWSQDYHAARAQSPEKDRLYRQYIDSIEKEIADLKFALGDPHIE
jgi:hypothetical protein